MKTVITKSDCWACIQSMGSCVKWGNWRGPGEAAEEEIEAHRRAEGLILTMKHSIGWKENMEISFFQHSQSINN